MQSVNRSVKPRRHRLSRRRLLQDAVHGGAGLAAWMALACGGGSKSPATTSGATPLSGTGATRTPHPRRGGTITLVIQGDAPHLDVHKTSTSYLTGYAPGAPYSGLVKPQSYGHGGRVIPTPDLAERWEQPEKNVYLFTVRKNAKFHNLPPVNGRLATAEDVVYSFNRQVAEKVNASYLAGMVKLQAVDATTVRLELESPNSDFLVTLCDPRNKIVAREAVELHGDLTNGPVIGTGPWIFTEWKRGVSFSTVRNPEYFIPELPYADAFVSPIIKDPAQIEAQFLAGRIISADIGTAGIARATAERLDKSRYRIYQRAPLASQWVMFNLDRPEFRDPRVRRALSLAIDRKLIINNVFDGKGQLDAMGMVLPGPDWSLPQAELEKLLAYDPKTAKQLLEAAGGLPKMTMHFYEAANSPPTAQLVQANWKAVGFDTELKSVDNIELTGSIFNPAVARYSVVTTAILHAPSLTGDLEAGYKTGGSRNSGKISDPELDRLIQAQKEEFEERKRRELVNQIQRRIAEQAYNLSLVASIGETVIAATTHNFEPLSQVVGQYSHIAEVWLEA